MTTDPKAPADRQPADRERSGDKPTGARSTPERTLAETGQGQGQSAGRPQTQPQE
jgi:hypothetical protein